MGTSRYSAENPPPAILEEIRKRLAPVCADWEPELFDTVTARAAWIEFKYDRALTDGFRGRMERPSGITRAEVQFEREESAR